MSLELIIFGIIKQYICQIFFTHSLDYNQQKPQVKVMCKDLPDTKTIDLNTLDMETSDIVLDESHEILQMKDPVETTWDTVKLLVYFKNSHRASKKYLHELTTSFISQYSQLNKSQR